MQALGFLTTECVTGTAHRSLGLTMQLLPLSSWTTSPFGADVSAHSSQINVLPTLEGRVFLFSWLKLTCSVGKLSLQLRVRSLVLRPSAHPEPEQHLDAVRLR